MYCKLRVRRDRGGVTMGGTMIIDGRKVEFTDEKNVLAVIRKAGITMPTLCYYS